MNYLNLYPINGLYDELYYPNLFHLSTEPLGNEGSNSLARLNGLYWANLFDEKLIRDAISWMRDYYAYKFCDVPHYCAVLGNTDYFVQRVIEASRNIVNQGISKKDFFSYVETISILCKIYTDFMLSPFTLTITDGILIDESNADSLISGCMSKTHNPYLDFLEKQAFPLIREINPELVFINGPIRMSTAAMARYAKMVNPGVHICVTRHASEYYSLNKISSFLKRNYALFSTVDSIILEECAETERKLMDIVSEGQSLSQVENLLYIDRINGEIIETEYAKQSKVSFESSISRRPRSFALDVSAIDPSEIIDAKLFPNQICPWLKCAFCGINHKYKIDDLHGAYEPLETKLDSLEKLVADGVKYVWFIDEAIPAEELALFATAVLERGLSIIWQVRARMDWAFTEDVCALLAKSGLREIRFGLESGSLATLRRMNKFPPDFSFELVDVLLERMNDVGISVHFPIITGFPGETKGQRMETYSRLQDYKRKYPSMTFNINLLGLDISSELYRRHDDFDLTKILLPCPPKHYIGNILNEWADENGEFDRATLSGEQTLVMRELLYSDFYPQSSLTPPHILYRLSETIRNTLIWKATEVLADPLPHFDTSLILRLSSSVSVHRQDSNNALPSDGKVLTTLFDLCNNNHITVDSVVLEDIIELFKNPTQVEQALRCFLPNSEEYVQVFSFIERAYKHQLLVICERG